MRRVLVLLAVAALLTAPVAAGEYRDPGVVNRFLTQFETPQLSPGETGTLSLLLSNPLSDSTMSDVILVMEMYQYLTVNDRLPISGVEHAPYFLGSGNRTMVFRMDEIPPLGSVPVELAVVTDEDTPHGAYFSQAGYAIRSHLRFRSNGSEFVYQSRGFFSDADWESLFDDTDTGPRLNDTRLFGMGLDGIIPDTSFGVRKDIPRICLYLLYGGIAALLLTGYVFYVRENPAAFPWLYRKLAYAKGRMTAKRTRRRK